MKRVDLIGKTFRRLTVLSDCGRRNKAGGIIWSCICECGKLTEVESSNLRSGGTGSCGCLQEEVRKNNRRNSYKHGDRHTRLYTTWSSMKNRCSNLRSQDYKNYGGRGIKVCEEWKESFIAFRFWAILNGYQENLTIDRIDNNRNYEPDNCQWLTRAENTSKAQKGIKEIRA